MSDLKPCPHCGESRAFVEDIETAQGLNWYVFCYACGATGGYEETPAKAIEAWNTRAERTCKRVLFEPTGVLVCSECGAGMPKQLDKHCYLHYCPNCGARVERGNK